MSTENGGTNIAGGVAPNNGSVPMEHGKMALILWCRAMSEGAEGVDIVDFGDSWQDGLGFCAIISRFVPTEVLNFASLGSASRADNLNLAFSAADKVGVPRLLAVDDMADKRNIFTWITHLYHSLTPLAQQNLTVLRSGDPDPVWHEENLRLIQNRFALCSSKPVTATSPKYVGDDLHMESLSGVRVALIPYSEVHKELRTPELDAGEPPVIVIYNEHLTLITSPTNGAEVETWYSYLTKQMIGSVLTPSVVPAAPVHEGWLAKRGDKGVSRGFKKRYFVLKDYTLWYGPKQFSADEKQSEKNMYSLKLSTEIAPTPALGANVFTIELPQRSVVLRAETKQAMDQWVSLLQETRDAFLRSCVQLVPVAEKEGLVQLDSTLIPSGQYYVVCRQGILFLNDRERPTIPKSKIPLYESDAELCAGVNDVQSVRITIGNKDARNSRMYTITSATQEDTLQWLDVINRQRQLMDAYVNSAAWPSTPDDDDEDV